jgi:hypothetical protein
MLTSTSSAAAARATTAKPPSRWLRAGSVLVPLVKCAVCPVCLGLFGTALAEASASHQLDERVHWALSAFAVAAGLAVLLPSFRHHLRPEPLALWAAGSALAAAGHVSEAQAQESVGFALLLASSLLNLLLLRRYVAPSSCCNDA